MLKKEIIAKIEECGCFEEVEYPEENLDGKTFNVNKEPVTLIVNKISIGPVVSIDTIGKALHVWINPYFIGFDFNEPVLTVAVSYEEVDAFEVID
ncbi:MAG: hypothetical protein U1C19_05630 [Methanobacteriaceae archaeon]|jgi:hypothetical protein|nr:hypothetical protein [Methanobacteriaceae archaeon]